MSVIGLVGAGQLGTVLAKRLVAVGHKVKIANSRGPESLREVTARSGATAVDILEAGLGSDMLILAVPLKSVPTLAGRLFATLARNTVVVDAGNYVPLRDGRIEDIERGMPESLWVSRALGVPVVKAFNSISDISLEEGGKPATASNRIALPVAGDDRDARSVVMRLVDQLGFDAFDAGPLSESWRQQLGQPAYCTDGTLRQLPSLLARARSHSVVPKREEAMKLMTKLPSDFDKATLLKAARFMAGLDRARPGSWMALLRVASVMARRAM